MNNSKYIISLLFMLIFSTSCKVNKNNTSLSNNVKPSNIRNYYFPVENLEEPLVYVYEEEYSKDQLIWELSSEEGNGDTLFTTISYYADSFGLKVIEEIYESIDEQGAIIIRYRENQEDEFGRSMLVESEIQENLAYKWSQEIGEKITWDSRVDLVFYPDTQKKIKRIRELKNTESQIIFNDKKYKAIIFHGSFEIVYSSPSFQDTISFSQESTYINGIGMYGYNRIFDNGNKANYSLKKIYTKGEWMKVLDSKK